MSQKRGQRGLEEERVKNPLVPGIGRKSLCLISSQSEPTVRKFLNLSISRKTTAKSKGKAGCIHA